MSINWDSINKKIDDYMKSDVGKKRLLEASKDAVFDKGADISLALPGVVAAKFIECLENAKRNIVYTDSPNAAAAMGTWHYNIKESKNGKSFVVEIIPDNPDRSRESVDPDRYPDGVYDILVLLDKGYYAQRSIYGPWHGTIIKTRASFNGYHFIDQAIKDFNNNYRKKYGVKRINRPVFNRSWDGFDEE